MPKLLSAKLGWWYVLHSIGIRDKRRENWPVLFGAGIAESSFVIEILKLTVLMLEAAGRAISTDTSVVLHTYWRHLVSADCERI